MDICLWSLEDNETHSWTTWCGKEHSFMFHRTPVEEGFKTCPYCSRTLAQDITGYIPGYDHYDGIHRGANFEHLRNTGSIKS